MFKNKSANGKNNICGENIRRIRKELGLSQNELSIKLQIAGLDLDKNAIQRIEVGKRHIIDIELVKLAEVLNVSLYDLLE